MEEHVFVVSENSAKASQLSDEQQSTKKCLNAVCNEDLTFW